MSVKCKLQRGPHHDEDFLVSCLITARGRRCLLLPAAYPKISPLIINTAQTVGTLSLYASTTLGIIVNK